MTSYHQNKAKYSKVALYMLAAIVILFAVACSIGSANIGMLESLRILWSGIPFIGKLLPQVNTPDSFQIILLQVRLPRAILSFLVGGALAIMGASLQGMFKNPLADPHILGISAGAGLGATIAIILGLRDSFAGIGSVTGFAFIGAIGAVFLVYALSRVKGRITTSSLLLAGIAVSSLVTALISALMILNRNKLEQVVLWTMGSFSTTGWTQLIWSAPLILIGALLSWFFARDLNLLLLGDEEARHLGVEIQKTKRWLLIITSFTTAAAVSVSGIIGFVGLMVPHMVRLVLGPDHRVLLPFSFLTGGCFLLLVDTLARTVASPLEIPVGILTAILGGPFFLYLLRKRGI